MKNQGKSDKQVRDSEIAAAVGFIGVFLTLLYLVIFNQKKQFKALYNTHQQFNTYIQYGQIKMVHN